MMENAVTSVAVPEVEEGAEVSLFTQLGQAEHLAHILEGYLGVFILYPHGLGRIYRRAAAHGNYPIRLELEHGHRRRA